MSNVVKTKKGTDLPLSLIKGKEYLEVKYRLMWFLEEKEDWTIETEIIVSSPESSTVRAVVKNPEGKIVRTAHKTEDKQGFNDHLEKAETGAIGRALGLMGYGTLHAQELDEGERIVDAPIPPKQPNQKPINPPKFSTDPDHDEKKVPRCWECSAVMFSGPYGFYCPNVKDKSVRHSKGVKPDMVEHHIEQYEKILKKREKEMGLNYEVS